MEIPATVRVLLPDGSVKTLPLEKYVSGVVNAVLEPDAPPEAAKAIAVAARTFATTTHRHTEQSADVCAQRHCQVWQDRAGILPAVVQTRGIVAMSDGHAIDAYYFEHCDGRTRDATGILLYPPAYLRSVSCPCGFATLKGHGVGMCLAGARVMARFGDTFETILKYYFNGIALEATNTAPRVAPELQAPVPPPVIEQPPSVKRPRVVTRPRRAKPRRLPSVEPPPQSTTTSATAGENQSAVPPLQRETREPTTREILPAAAPAVELPAQAEPPPAPLDATSETPTVQVPRAEAESATIETQPIAAPVAENAEADISIQDARVVPTEAVAESMTVSPLEEESWYPLAEEFGAVKSSLEALDSEEVNDFKSNDLFTPSSENVLSKDEGEEEALELLIPPPDSMPEELTTIFAAPMPAPRVAPPDSLPEELVSFAHAPQPTHAPVPIAPTRTEPAIIIDRLPGLRLIAGNLPHAGILVTIRDARGHSVVTVSGAAKQHGAGGFEAPLMSDGNYQVIFDGQRLDVRLDGETIFIHYEK